MKKTSVNLGITRQYTKKIVPEAQLRMLADRIYSREKIPGEKKTMLIFCSDYYIRKLNSKYRSKDKATDVLSFPFNETDLLGEIYISIPRAMVQAQQYGTSFSDEVKRLFIHGLLHLTGYDHIEKQDQIKMEKAENRYLNSIIHVK